MKIQFYSDPGHGWFKVERALLIKMGILDEITGWSYQRKTSVYLEEDCDAGRLFKALDAAGIAWTYRENHTDKTSKIRAYQRFNKQA
jgi:hypothetical protein